jgi:hypothetical protein
MKELHPGRRPRFRCWFAVQIVPLQKLFWRTVVERSSVLYHPFAELSVNDQL